MVMDVDEEKKILDALLDDDESFIVRKRKKEERIGEDRIENIVKQVRETIKKRAVEEEEKPAQVERLERIKQRLESQSVGVPELEKVVVSEPREERRVKISKPKFKEQPYLSDVEINVLKAIMRYGANVRRISRVTGYPDVIISKAIEKLMEKGYIDENLNVAEKAIPIAGIPEEEGNIGVRIIDVAIVITAIVLILSTLYYFGYI